MGKTSFLNKGLSWTQHDTTAESLPAPDSCPAKVITRHCYIQENRTIVFNHYQGLFPSMGYVIIRVDFWGNVCKTSVQ